MAKEGIGTFEIPSEMRTFAEKSMEQAKQAFESFAVAAQHAATTAENQAVSARSCAKEIGELAMSFAERNIASSFDFAQRLFQAKNAQDVAALHSDYVKNQVATLTDQAKELSKRAAKMAGPATQH